MENYCSFSKNHKCLKWMDYQLTRFELELEAILREFGIDIPDDTYDELPE